MGREYLSENGINSKAGICTTCWRYSTSLEEEEGRSCSSHFSSMESEYSVYSEDYRYPESERSFDFSSQRRSEDELPIKQNNEEQSYYLDREGVPSYSQTTISGEDVDEMIQVASEMTRSQEYYILAAEEMEVRETNELRDQLSDLRISPLTQEINEELEFRENFPSSQKYFQDMAEQIEAEETNRLRNEFLDRKSSEENFFEDMADAYDAESALSSETVSQSQEWAEQYLAFYSKCSQCGQRVCLKEDIENGYANDFCVSCM